jgi:hypothetical protein
MKCINCNRKVNEGIGYYNTDSGPLCIICHDLKIEANELKLLKNVQKSSHQKLINKKDEKNS